LIGGLVRLNGAISVFKSQGSVDVSGFLAAQRLALIELRLQLDVPPDHRGDLLQPDLSAAACDILDLLMLPLLCHEEDLTDSQVDTYFQSVNSMIHDAFEIFRAVKGQRDRDRVELKCLLVIVAKWLREAPFLCQNRDIVTGVKPLIQTLAWFPIEAVHFVPAFEELHQKESQQFRAAVVGCPDDGAIDMEPVVELVLEPDDIADAAADPLRLLGADVKERLRDAELQPDTAAEAESAPVPDAVPVDEQHV
jgi:hypothetical protein